VSGVPRLSRVLETSLYVADLARSRRFYQDVFGFELLLEDGRMVALGVPGEAVLLLFRLGGSTEPSPTPGGVIPPHDGRGTQHLCFAIPLASLEDWAQHLQRRGVAIESRVVQSHGGTSLYVRDPDGHSLEVAVPGLWPNY
jgi:catechol 2,3-dioxygenase-like lactoylglutathione lyase family enzyme